jgi:hypothetical protein
MTTRKSAGRRWGPKRLDRAQHGGRAQWGRDAPSLHVAPVGHALGPRAALQNQSGRPLTRREDAHQLPPMLVAWQVGVGWAGR